MIRSSIHVTAIACALGAIAAPLAAQQDLGRDGTSWRWDGAVPAGGTLKLFNLNGALHFTASPDASVHVSAEKHVHAGGDARAVHYAVVRDGNNLTICAMWRDDATCTSDGVNGGGRSERQGHDRRRNVTAEIAIQVPSGVDTDGNTINGEVSAENLSADVQASTVNGTVRISQAGGDVTARSVNGDVKVDTRGGVVSAVTVNGSVSASMARQATGDMRFRSVNGDVDISTSGQLNADVSLSTLNGSVDTRYTLHFDRRRRHAEGVVGKGGPHLTASTVNGSVTLR